LVLFFKKEHLLFRRGVLVDLFFVRTLKTRGHPAGGRYLAGAMDAMGRKPDRVDFAETYVINAPTAFAVFNPPLARAAE
jgi:hypothetical protein